MKQLDSFLHTLFWFAPGMFAGIALETYLDVRNHPGLYEMQSAPLVHEASAARGCLSDCHGGGLGAAENDPKKALTIKNAEADEPLVGLCAIFIEYDCDC